LGGGAVRRAQGFQGVCRCLRVGGWFGGVGRWGFGVGCSTCPSVCARFSAIEQNEKNARADPLVAPAPPSGFFSPPLLPAAAPAGRAHLDARQAARDFARHKGLAAQGGLCGEEGGGCGGPGRAGALGGSGGPGVADPCAPRPQHGRMRGRRPKARGERRSSPRLEAQKRSRHKQGKTAQERRSAKAQAGVTAQGRKRAKAARRRGGARGGAPHRG
jgi:hypothetical protein